MIKKFLSITFALLLMFPVMGPATLTAYAAGEFKVQGGSNYDNLSDALENVPEGGTVTMTDDVTINQTGAGDVELSADKKYTLDLSGNTLTLDGDCSLLISDGNVTIQNGTIEAVFADAIAVLITDGHVTMDKLTVRANNGEWSCGITVDGRKTSENGITYETNAVLDIISGNYQGGEDAVFCYFGTTYITSGSFLATEGTENRYGCLSEGASGDIFIRSGSYADKENWLKGSKEVAVSVHENFKVNDKIFGTLKDAVAAAAEGGTVTMLQNVEVPADLVLNFNKTYTIDLGGYTLSNAGEGVHNLLKIDAGKITVRNGTIYNDYYNAVTVNGGALILDDVIITADADDNTSDIYAVGVFGASVSILSGRYYGTSNAVHCSSGTVTITAGEFISDMNGYYKYSLRKSGSGQLLLAQGSSANADPWMNTAGAASVTITESEHIHTWGDWQSDAENHWKECDCGEIDSLAPHTPGDWIVDAEATETTDGSRHRECTVCGYIIATEVIPATGPAEIEYEIISGANSSWKKGTASSLTIICNGDLDKFSGLKVDDVMIGSESYTKTSGSTVIAFKASYLESLNAGKHTVEFVYSDGNAQTELTILAADDPIKPTDPGTAKPGNPKTGDDKNYAVWFWIGGTALLIMAGMIILEKKKWWKNIFRTK